MSVKAREEAAKFELNGSKWMGNQLQIYEVNSQKNHSKQAKPMLGNLSSKTNLIHTYRAYL